MNYTKCLNCGSEWKSPFSVTRCPFCLADLKTDPTSFQEIESAMAFIIRKYGKDIVSEPKRFISLLSDYIQIGNEDYYILDFTLKNNVYSELCAVDPNNTEAVYAAKAKALHKLNILNPSFAKKAVFWMTYALGWENPIEEKNVAPQPVIAPELPPVNIKVGDIVKYGMYPQDARGNLNNIEWKVLHVEGGKALLFATKCLDVQPFNTSSFFGNYWEKSTLRSWLNSTFKDKAFDQDDQQYIIKTGLRPSYNPRSGKPNGYSDVIDEIFLLSREDIDTYSIPMKELAAAPTLYSISKKIFNSTVDNTAYWWLRSPGYEAGDSMIVTHKGRKDDFGLKVDSKNCGVRPALWVNTKAFR